MHPPLSGPPHSGLDISMPIYYISLQANFYHSTNDTIVSPNALYTCKPLAIGHYNRNNTHTLYLATSLFNANHCILTTTLALMLIAKVTWLPFRLSADPLREWVHSPGNLVPNCLSLISFLTKKQIFLFRVTA